MYLVHFKWISHKPIEIFKFKKSHYFSLDNFFSRYLLNNFEN